MMVQCRRAERLEFVYIYIYIYTYGTHPAKAHTFSFAFQPGMICQRMGGNQLF